MNIKDDIFREGKLTQSEEDIPNDQQSPSWRVCEHCSKILEGDFLPWKGDGRSGRGLNYTHLYFTFEP